MSECCIVCDRAGCIERRAEAETASTTALQRWALDRTEENRVACNEPIRLHGQVREDCRAHTVDWRARAIAVGADLDAARVVLARAVEALRFSPLVEHDDTCPKLDDGDCACGHDKQRAVLADPQSVAASDYVKALQEVAKAATDWIEVGRSNDMDPDMAEIALKRAVRTLAAVEKTRRR